MFRPMRRNKQELSPAETKQILSDNATGTLALLGDNGYPYSLPINYYFDGENKIYFHCAKQGHKLDAIQNEEKVSMSVISKDDIYQEKFTTLYVSAIVFGKARILTNQEEINLHCTRLAEKLCPDNINSIPEEINAFASAFTIVEITIEHMTGKECIELTKQR